MYFFLALLVAIIGALPLILNKKPKLVAAAVVALIYTLVGWFFTYMLLPGSVMPLFGGFGVMVLLWFAISAIVDGVMEDNPTTAALFPLALALIYGGIAFFNNSMFRNEDLASLIGKVETREWTQDVQPKDPKHVRLVPHELAAWLANKQLGSMPGAVGSQFQIYPENLTLQRIDGELWYVAPLDFKGFKAWTAAKTAPGYVMVHGEDPRRTPIIKSGLEMKYTEHASLGHNLRRHLWNKGYRNIGLMDFSFEIEDGTGKHWYIVTTYKPTIGWGGKVVTGILQINPDDGAITPYTKENAPSWVDRVVPAQLVSYYIDKHGQFRGGWWNAIWKHLNVFEGENPTISYGNDGSIYWVTSVTSPNTADEAMIGLYYTNVHTGVSTYYHATGGTEAAVLTAVNNTVGYKKWHGAGPVLYNVYGTMAAIVPVLGENETFQGVAIVNVASLKVAFGETEYEAYRLYQRDLEMAGQSVAPENFHDAMVIDGRVTRFASDVQSGTTIYYLTIDTGTQIFMGGSERSLEMPLTQVGDQIHITYDESTEEIVPMLSFDNLELTPPSQIQSELRTRVSERQTQMSTARGALAAKDALQKLSDAELLELMKLREGQEK